MERIFSLQDIEVAASWLLSQLGSRKVVALHGAMGAGKTTLTSAIIRVLGSKDSASSPTFSIINEYRLPEGKVFHMDWYRLRDEEEAIQAGVEDALYSGHLCLVEWPDKAPGLLPEDTFHVWLIAESELSRKITLINSKF